MKASTLAQISVELESRANGWTIISISQNAIEGIILELEAWDSSRVERITFDTLTELKTALDNL